MRRFLLLPLLAFLAMAAGPAEEAERLIGAGQEREAFALVERAAAVNDPGAIDFLAWFYDEGRVVAQDRGRAAALYRRAAERGHANAQWRLGVMLDRGEGVRADPAEAARWFRRAMAQNLGRAHTSLAVMYANGRGMPQDYGEAMRHYRAGAELGEPHGFFGIGVLHLQGEGVRRDPGEAFAWFAVAASLGFESAQEAMDEADLDEPAIIRAIARANAIVRETGVRAPEIRYDSGTGPEPDTRPAPIA
jgi:hypothetical protein